MAYEMSMDLDLHSSVQVHEVAGLSFPVYGWGPGPTWGSWKIFGFYKIYILPFLTSSSTPKTDKNVYCTLINVEIFLYKYTLCKFFNLTKKLYLWYFDLMVKETRKIYDINAKKSWLLLFSSYKKWKQLRLRCTPNSL